MIKYIRLIHFYLGVFFAPTIIFFSFSGMLQTFSFHENHDGKPGIPWVTALAEMHKNQRVPDTWTAKEPEAKSAPASGAKPAANVSTQNGTVAIDIAPASAAKKAEHDEEDDDDAKPAQNSAKPEGNTSNQSPNPAPPKRRQKSFPLKVFVGLMSEGLIISSLLGIYMAFKYARGPLLIWGLLILGTALPIALLYM